ncbi:hypothetical protein NPIL_14241, partial [Nephila pilipes]
GILEFLNK